MLIEMDIRLFFLQKKPQNQLQITAFQNKSLIITIFIVDVIQSTKISQQFNYFLHQSKYNKNNSNYRENRNSFYRDKEGF